MGTRRGCEVACYGRVDADDRQSGVATRAFRVRRFCWSALSVRIRFRCDSLDTVPKGPGGPSLVTLSSRINHDGCHRRKVYATLKAPRRRNRYALSTIFLPRYPLLRIQRVRRSLERIITAHISFERFTKWMLHFPTMGKTAFRIGYPVASHYCDVLRFIA